MKRILILFVVILLLGGCSCERQLSFLEKRCPECFREMHVIDTIVKKSVVSDTQFLCKFDSITDTFILERNEVKVRILRIKDTLFVETEIPADTIIVERMVQIPQQPTEKSWRWFVLLTIVVVIGVGIFIKKRICRTT